MPRNLHLQALSLLNLTQNLITVNHFLRLVICQKQLVATVHDHSWLRQSREYKESGQKLTRKSGEWKILSDF